MQNDRLTLQDPRQQYPQPPFPRQPQPVPGLAQQMDPQPDHGEQSYKGSGKLMGRKALITGGDSGIGRAVAISFAREGADVAISYLPSEESDAKAVIELIEQAGRKGIALPGDITDEQFCRQLVGNAVSALNGLDILVNNAGVQKSYPSILDIPTEHFDRLMKTNLYAMFWITQAAVPHLKPGAAIINTTSIQGYKPSATLVDYAMTKAAIADFSKALSKQLIEQGVRVNAVAPGPFWTPLQPTGGQTQDKIEKFGSEAPMGRPGQPVEIAPVYVLLASQEGSYITGEVYGVTGGTGIA
ncbi:SDR family oxidoreductase [Cyanobacteria bacterium FACHB-63]|nr:SDR family oxidoreductase [Cyanobacteria bacterium FACHB-63]